MYQDDDDEKDYNNLPNYDTTANPVEEGDVLNQEVAKAQRPENAAEDVDTMPDGNLVDGNEQEANQAIDDTAEEA